MGRLRRIKRTAVLCSFVAIGSGLLDGCAGKLYATPEEAIQHACSAFGPKALSGALIGGAAGAAGGAAIGAAAGGGRDAAYGALAGLIAGALVGAIAGNIADKGDCEQARIALQEMGNSPTGKAVAWRNYASGSYGAYTPVSDTRTVSDHLCREIRADYFIKNHSPVVGEPGYVCRTSNGDWGRVASLSLPAVPPAPAPQITPSAPPTSPVAPTVNCQILGQSGLATVDRPAECTTKADTAVAPDNRTGNTCVWNCKGPDSGAPK